MLGRAGVEKGVLPRIRRDERRSAWMTERSRGHGANRHVESRNCRAGLTICTPINDGNTMATATSTFACSKKPSSHTGTVDHRAP